MWDFAGRGLAFKSWRNRFELWVAVLRGVNFLQRVAVQHLKETFGLFVTADVGRSDHFCASRCKKHPFCRRIHNTRVLIVMLLCPWFSIPRRPKDAGSLVGKHNTFEFLILKVPRQGQVAKRRRQAVHPAPLPPTRTRQAHTIHRKCLQAPSTSRRARVPLVHPVLGNTVHVRIPLLSPSRREPSAPGTRR